MPRDGIKHRLRRMTVVGACLLLCGCAAPSGGGSAFGGGYGGISVGQSDGR